MQRRPTTSHVLLLVAASLAPHIAQPAPADAQYLPAPVAAADAAPALPVAADSKREPVLAGVLSAVIMGAGQAYNGEWLKAGLFFGGGLVLGGGTLVALNADDCNYGDSCGLAIGLGVAYLGLYVWNIVDAVLSAKKINRGLGVAGLEVHPSVAFRQPAPVPDRAPARRLEVRVGQLRF